MDNSRLLIATLLCFALLIGWQSFSEYMGWTPPPAPPVPVEESAPQPARPDAPAPAPMAPVQRFAPTEGRDVRVDTPLYSAVFHTNGGVLQSFTLKKYTESIGPDARPFNLISPAAAGVAPMGLMINGAPSWNTGAWACEGDDLSLGEGQSGTLVFTGDVNGLRVTRSISFSADSYYLDERTTLSSETALPAQLSHTLALTSISGGGNYDIMSMAWDLNGSFKSENSTTTLTEEGLISSGDIWWAGLMSNYFLAAVVPDQGAQLVFKGRILEPGGIWRVAVEQPAATVTPDAPLTVHTGWWMGAKDRAMLKAAPNDLSAAMDMGIFTFLAVPLLWLLSFLQSLVGNWGVAIILLTILIKLVFWPLTRKSFKSMEKMKQIQPMMKQLQEKYGKDKEALSREMMQLYKTYGVNPMGGCLPILIQLPVFVALYQALLHSIELRHAAFITYLPFTDTLWLADLSVKDPFYITPLVMGATMFLQQWLSPAMGDPTQRKMMMFMPLIFTVMFINFPSGLVLYWLVNNILSIAQQWWTLRKV
ncbi:MAG: membrane protein insertase YidC [Desulfovibrionaceae bacterium]|nr:membrane protein insertase YidC [Desulfovibrionaceae bacterium]